MAQGRVFLAFLPEDEPVFQRDFAHVMLSAREASRLSLRAETLRGAQSLPLSKAKG